MFEFSDDKRGTILRAAKEMFLTYGVRKTSMDDIARSACMSRPALYLEFDNKNDIFRALSLTILDHVAAAAADRLAGTGDFPLRLFEALDCSILAVHRLVDDTAHGTEIMGVNAEIVPDIECEWKTTMAGVIASGLDEAQRRGEINLGTLSSSDAGRLFMHAMEGIRAYYMRGNAIDGEVENLIGFFTRCFVGDNDKIAFMPAAVTG